MNENGRGMKRSALFILHPSSFILLFTLLLHADAIKGWWLYDDPQLVLEAQRQPLTSLFFNPAEYVHLAAHTFVPLQLVSYKIDLLFGVRPVVFYAHQLLALALAVVLLFFVLRQHIDEKFAAAGAALFASSWAATYAVRTLMIRHYVEGLVLALIALLLWRRRPMAASFFYLLAMLAKEVYAPLPLLFLLIEREPRRRFAWPAASFVIWLFWRWRMTQLVGGYAPFPSLREIAGLPPILWSHLIGPAHSLVAPLIFAIGAAAIVIAYLVRDRFRAAAIIITIAAVATAPIVALAGNFEWRYSFAFVACVIAALTIAAGRVNRRWSLIALSLLAVTATAMSFPQRRDYREQTRIIEAEGRYVASQPPTAASLAATAPEWYLGGLAQLRRAPSPRYFFSRFAIVAGEVDPARAVTFDTHAQLVPLTSATSFGTPSEWTRERAAFVASAPLNITFSLAHHDASWRLGPAGGEFTFLTSPGWTAIPIPPEGARRVPAARERQWFRIRRAAPDGSWTLSPVLPVPREGETTRWKRP
ncbi:MAG: hypothetical protein QOI24_3186 [Acidobacteriota bacterium]|jgi:hypothetical protein|nr:hypothetical protein [Acidobacteriota bacterium]